jgi:GABA permease
VTIAAAESEQPEEAVARAVRPVVYRVLIFYVLSIFLLVAVVPWDQVASGDSPFIAALDKIGIPGSAE